MKEVVIVHTGIANVTSVATGLRRAGVDVQLSDDRREIDKADRLVLPGVGAFAAGMQRLVECDLVETLRTRITAGRRTLAICLGMQLLGMGSEESPDVEGLGVIDSRATRFSGEVRVPQLGWNRVQPDADCRVLQDGHAYFANSYRLTQPPAGWASARTDHGGPFISAIERGAVLACQFHPELSGPWGITLLQRWLAGDVIEGATC
jgi:imidazole glycerol phosphate synthase glutamine amidotransferase subunit